MDQDPELTATVNSAASRSKLLRTARIAIDDRFREALHLFQLRAELQQHQVYANLFEFRHTFGNLFGCADQARPQPAIRNRVVFQRNALLQLCAAPATADSWRSPPRTAARR